MEISTKFSTGVKEFDEVNRYILRIEDTEETKGIMDETPDKGSEESEQLEVGNEGEMRENT